MELLWKIFFVVAFFQVDCESIKFQAYEECKDLWNVFHLHPTTKITECIPVELSTEYTDNDRIWRLSLSSPNRDRILLNLRKVDQTVINLDTPIWLGINNRTKEEATTYDRTTIGNYFPGLLKTTPYYDVVNKAVVLNFFSHGNGVTTEGFVDNYVLRMRPDSDIVRKYVLLKLATRPIKGYKWMTRTRPDAFNLNATELTNINTKLFIALDWTPSAHIYEQIKCIFIYYNVINMLYSQFINPKISFTIKGIVIPENKYSSPYLISERDDPDYIDLGKAMDDMKYYFTSKEAKIFGLTKYDIVIGMSSLPFCWEKNVCNINMIVTESTRMCNKNDPEASEFPTIVGIRSPNIQGGYSMTAQLIALLFGGDFIPRRRITQCSGIMNKPHLGFDTELPLTWSECTIRSFSDYLRSSDCRHFKNTSYSLNLENNQIPIIPTNNDIINLTKGNVSTNVIDYGTTPAYHWWNIFSNFNKPLKPQQYPLQNIKPVEDIVRDFKEKMQLKPLKFF